MITGTLESNIWKLRLFYALRFALFFMPIIVLYFQSYELSYVKIFLTQVIFSAVLLFGAVPGGYYCDRFGRKHGIILGGIFLCLGFIGFALGKNFTIFSLAEIAIGIGYALFSGAAPALLFDSLQALKREKEYTYQEGLVEASGRYAEAIAAVAGAGLAMISLKLPFYAQLIMGALVILCACTLREAPRTNKATVRPLTKLKTDFHLIKISLRKQSRILWLLLFSASINLATLSAIWLYQPYFKEMGLSLAWFGIGWGLLNLSTAFGAGLADKIQKWFSVNSVLLGALFIVAIASFIFYFWMSAWVFLFALAAQAARGVKIPVVYNQINLVIDTSYRATILSLDASFTRLFFIIFAPWLGYMADHFQLGNAFLILGCACLVLGLVTYLGYWRKSVITAH